MSMSSMQLWSWSVLSAEGKGSVKIATTTVPLHYTCVSDKELIHLMVMWIHSQLVKLERPGSGLMSESQGVSVSWYCVPMER